MVRLDSCAQWSGRDVVSKPFWLKVQVVVACCASTGPQGFCSGETDFSNGPQGMESGGDAIGVVRCTSTFSPVASCDADTVASTAAASPQLVFSTAALEFRPQVSPRTSCSFQGGGKWFQVEPRREVRGSLVESAAIGGSFSCFRRRKFPREGGDRGVLDPSKDSSPGSTCGGAVEVVRGVFGAIAEEVGRGAGRSGTHKSKVGQIERGSGICTPSGCHARLPSGGQSFCERSSSRQKERHQRNVHASDKGSPSPEGASKRCRIQFKSCGIG